MNEHTLSREDAAANGRVWRRTETYYATRENKDRRPGARLYYRERRTEARHRAEAWERQAKAGAMPADA